MSTIPTSITEEQFDAHVRPYISTAQRGFECQIPLYKVFNYILYRYHTRPAALGSGLAPHARDGEMGTTAYRRR